MALLESDAEIGALLPKLKRIAILGIKTPETRAPAFYVPEYAQRAGVTIVPVPVDYPEVKESLGEPVYRRLADVPGELDSVVVFRRPADIPAHLDDILAAKPKSVWMQLGIRHEEVAARLNEAGIDVVQDRCLLVEMQERGL